MEFILRNATVSDIPFLVETIIESEKSGAEILSYTQIFGITEEETRKYLSDMFLEEIDGCEFSVSSYLIAEYNGEIAASVAAWIEGSEGVPSAVLKGNLLNFTLPKNCIERAINLSGILRQLHIEYVVGAVQIGVVYVALQYRGKNLVSRLIDEQISRLVKANPAISAAYVQVFGINLPAIKAYEKSGFSLHSVKTSPDKEILQYLPSDKKILMKREWTTNKIS